MSRARVPAGSSSSTRMLASRGLLAAPVPSRPSPSPRARIRLDWAGRAFEPAPRAPLAPALASVAASGTRVLEEVSGAGPAVRFVRGDALDVARALAPLRGSVDLLYVDPPFASESDYVHEARLDGPADGRIERTLAFGDRWGRGDEGLGAYLDMLAPRLEAMAQLLAPTGSLWVHLDWRAAYLVRVLMDEILGRAAFKNEIVWKRAPNLGRQAKSQQFGRTLDTLLVYGGPACVLVPPTRLEPITSNAIRRGTKGASDDESRPFTCAPRGDYTDASIARLEAEGRVHRTPSGKVYIKYYLVKNADGVWCRERPVDTLWTDIPPLRHAAAAERTGYPTQKPRALLERIITCATKPGGLVVDLFAGSGTTGEAAHALGRRAVLGDLGAVSQATTRARLLRAGAPLRVETCSELPGEDAAGPCSVEMEPLDEERVRLRLRSPESPLAWAIDTDARAGAPFQTSWHSERHPGVRAVPVAREALVTVRGDLEVRAYGEDGSLFIAHVPRAVARDEVGHPSPGEGR